MRTPASIEFLVEKSTKSLFYALILLLPLVVTSFTNEGYEFPKTTILIILGSFFSILFYGSIRISDYANINKKGLIFFIYFASFLLSVAFSEHLYTSIFGYFSRFNGGLTTLLIYMSLYLYSKLKTNALTTVYFAIAASLPVTIVGIMQTFSDESRIYSTFGQPNWLGMYYSMILPLILWLLIKSNKTKDIIITALIFLLSFFVLWKTYSISALLGFICAISLLIQINWKMILVVRKRLLLLLLMMALVALTNSEFLLDRLYDALQFLRNKISSQVVVFASENNSPVTYRVSDTGDIRFHIWTGSLKLILNDPKTLLFGTGPETFPYVFQRVRPEEMNYSSEWDYIMNKPHNYFLEILVEQGLISLIFYLIILARLMSSKNKIYGPSLLGYVVCSFFGWPSVYNELLFWIMAGLTMQDRESVSSQI